MILRDSYTKQKKWNHLMKTQESSQDTKNQFSKSKEKQRFMSYVI